MRKIEAYTTADGRVFETLESAKRHAEKRYGELLSSLAHGVARVEKYTEAHDWLESHYSDLATLAALHNDTFLERE